MTRLVFIISSLFILLLTGCANVSNITEDKVMIDDKSKSILILPLVNDSTEVAASNIVPIYTNYYIAEAGYYVYSPLLIKTILEQEGIYEANDIKIEDMAHYAELFNVDNIVVAKINKWGSTYTLLDAVTYGEVHFKVYDKTGALVLEDTISSSYSPNSSSNSDSLSYLVASIISATVERAAPSYEFIGHNLNLRFVGSNFKVGPYAKKK